LAAELKAMLKKIFMNQFDNFEKFLQKEFEHFESETSDQSWEEIRAKLHPKPRRRLIGFWFLPFFALLSGAYFFYARPEHPQGNDNVAVTLNESHTDERPVLVNTPSVQMKQEEQTKLAVETELKGSAFSEIKNRHEKSLNKSAQSSSEVRNNKTRSAELKINTVEFAANMNDNPDVDENTANAVKEKVAQVEGGKEQREVCTLVDAVAILWPAEVVENNGVERLPAESRTIVTPVNRQKDKGIRLSGSIGLCTNYQLLSANTADNFYVSTVNAPDLLSIDRMGIQANIGLRFQLSRQFSLRPSLSYQGFKRQLDYVVYENEVKSWTGVSFGNSYELSGIEFKNTQIRERGFNHTVGLQADLMWSPNKRHVLSIGAGIGRTRASGISIAQWVVCSWQHRLQRYAIEPFVQYNTRKYAGLDKYYYYQPLSFGIKFGF